MGKSVSVVNCPFRPLSRNIYSYSWIKPQACSFLLVSNKWFYFPILKKFRLILKFQCFIHFKVSSIPQVGPSWGWKFCNEKTQVLLVSSATLLLLLFRSLFFKSSSVRIGEQEEVRTGKVCPYDIVIIWHWYPLRVAAIQMLILLIGLFCGFLGDLLGIFYLQFPETHRGLSWLTTYYFLLSSWVLAGIPRLTLKILLTT